MAEAGELKIIGTDFWLMDALGVGHSFTGEEVVGTFGEKGRLKVKGDYIHYMDWHGDQRRLLGVLTGETGEAGDIRIKGKYFYYMDFSGKERVLKRRIPFAHAYMCSPYIAATYRTWEDLRAAEQTEALMTGNWVVVSSTGQQDKWFRCDRFAMFFDVQSLAGEDIQFAQVAFKVLEKVDDLNLNPSIALYYLDYEDPITQDLYHEHFGTTKLSDSLSWSSLHVGGWHLFTLNATGLAIITAAISEGKYAAFGVRVNKDVSGVEPEWVSGEHTVLEVQRSYTPPEADDRFALIIG